MNPSINRLRQRLHNSVLDGGLATELEALGADIDCDLWSARVLAESPERITKVHELYLKSGSDCIISSSYQASVEGFVAAGFSMERAHVLLADSVIIAKNVRERINPSALVAASIGPYGAYLADGSEYRGYANVSEARLREFHLDRWRILAAAKPDLMACETIPSAAEAAVLNRIAHVEETPFWLCFSCSDAQRICSGETLATAAAELANNCFLVGWGINCTSPQFVSELVRILVKLDPNIPVIVYPNSGERYEAETSSWSGTVDPIDFAERAQEWRALGAWAVGGCCRTGPQHIAALRHFSLPHPR